MTDVGQIERRTQKRVVQLFRDTLGYDYLGDWHDRKDNQNIEEAYLRTFLVEQGYSNALITRAVEILIREASDQSRSLYDVNRDVYSRLRYGVQVKTGAGEQTQTVYLVDWKHPERNHLAIAEEVTVLGKNTKRPDVVLYLNGIAVGVLELKRSIVSVSEGIRQNLDNQKPEFIRPFFSTIQLVMAGNDTQGLRYGTTRTTEKYHLTWKEANDTENLLDRHLTQLCERTRLLDILHNFIVFDAGTKKICRANQYFGVQAAQPYIEQHKGGIIWHTQGSGKSLTMVWLAKWIREHVQDARVLIITDRTELDEQIEKVFKGVQEEIYRTKSGEDLIHQLNAAYPWLICSLIHKFGGREGDSENSDVAGFVTDIRRALPPDFKAKGDIFVFIDECHRTQSGDLHRAMTRLLPGVTLIGFTGTPLLKRDKQTSLEVFGPYIHTYKYNEAIADGVVLDLQYEARDIDQVLTSQDKIDRWFESKTTGLTRIARAQLKQKWGTMQKVLSSQSRLEKIVADILFDMEIKDRLKSGRGNAMLVTGSIFEACKCYELFEQHGLKEKCAIVTSYKPSPADIKGEETGEGLTERLRQYAIYQKMLADYFHQPPDEAVTRAEEFERAVKKTFIDKPGEMKLLIVVDKLLTGFDAPSATYLYLDKQMQDHALFQAICRVNRLDGEDKEYGYIIDYMDLFKSLKKSIHDYTSEAFDGYDQEDVKGLLSDRLEKSRERLEDARERIKALCEYVESPRDSAAYRRYFLPGDLDDPAALKNNEQRRLALYKNAAALLRAYANLANDMIDAGYTAAETDQIREEVEHYEKVRMEIKLASGDYIDLKMYEPAMRHLLDTYIRAEEPEKISAFDDMNLIQLIVEQGPEAVNSLPKGIRSDPEAVSETIEHNVRKVIVDESPINPMYYERMSILLDALIKERKAKAIEYKAYLDKIVELTKKIANAGNGEKYPTKIDSSAKRALYDNLDEDESLALAVDWAVHESLQDSWQFNSLKTKRVRLAIKKVLQDDPRTDAMLELVKNQQDYQQDYQ